MATGTKRMIHELRRELRARADPRRAEIVSRFFKTGPGQYGAGDRFLGIGVPVLRSIARRYRDCALHHIQSLLRSKLHEERIVALLIMVDRYRRGTPQERESVIALYLENADRVNNWDLIDLSAPPLLGMHMADRDRAPLYRLARSPSLWERRMAIVATLHFIRRGDTGTTFAIAEILLGDSHDLIHKAAGWMLREAGKRDRKALLSFLDRHTPCMPRTMLRYSLEKLPARLKERYMRAKAQDSPRSLKKSR